MNDPLVQNQGSVEKQANVGNNSGTIIVGSDNSQGQIHIHQGMNSDEVRALCLDLVQKELALYKQQASDESMRRFNLLMEKFLDLLAEMNELKRQKLQEPAIQFAINETFKEYIKSGNEELGDDLMDLMIERMEVDEHTTKQLLIDEARQILPKLSVSTISLICIITFSQLIIPRDNVVFIEMLHKLSPILSRLEGLSGFDVAYLEQVRCGQSLSIFDSGKNFEQRMLSSYNLLFLHPISIDQFNSFVKKHGYNQGEVSDVIMFIHALMDTRGQQMCFNKNSFRNEQIIGNNKDEIIQALTFLTKEMTPFNEDEVKQFFLNIDKNWHVVSNIFNRGDIKNFVLSPVGSYIGLRRLSKMFRDNIPLSVFYQD